MDLEKNKVIFNQDNDKLNKISNEKNKGKYKKNDIIKSDTKKIFKSASLTFYDKDLGYLLCEEFRYKEKKNLIHTIGGKVETSDNNIFFTAIREFIEETNLESHNFFNQKNLSKEELIKELVKMFENKVFYRDLCINKEFNYYHRYYMINLNVEEIMCQDIINNIHSLPDFFNGIFKTEIENIHWINGNNLEIYKSKFSWLTKMFIRKLNL